MSNTKLFYKILFALLILATACKKDNDPEQKISHEFFTEELVTKTFTEANQFEGLTPQQQEIGQQFIEEAKPQGIIFYDYKVAAITYKTTGPDGKQLAASGIITYPVAKNFRGVILAPMYTYMSSAEAPSVRMNTEFNYFAWLGYVVITPDYIGFNASEDKPHPYLHRNLTGTTCADMVLAAREYMKNLGMPIVNNIYIIGFSQGGASALMTQRVIQEKYTNNTPNNIPILEVYSGAGPHDLKTTFDDYCKKKTTGFPCSVPYIALGLNYGDNLKLDFSKVFKGNLLANYTLWYSKKYNSDQINTFLGTKDLTLFMHEDMFKEEKNDQINNLYKACVNNSNISDWKPSAPVHFYASDADTFVPSYNTHNAYKFFKDKGCVVTETALKGEHLAAGTSFFKETLWELYWK